MSESRILRRGTIALAFLVASMLPVLAQQTQGGGIGFGAPPVSGTDAGTPAGGPPPLPAPAPQLPPPLPAPAPAAQYWVGVNGAQTGPFSIDDLKAQIAAKTLTRDSLVWKTGTPTWVAASTLPDLSQVFGSIPPSLPADAQFKQFLLGTWQSDPSSPVGSSMTVRTTLTYTPDGRFNGYQTYSMQGLGGGNSVPLTGTWSVVPITSTSFTLTANINGFGSQTIPLTVIDNNTVQSQNDNSISHRIH